MPIYESGHSNGDKLISLGGVVGVTGNGRKVDRGAIIALSGVNALILSDNPRRISAIIHLLTTSVGHAIVDLGGTGTACLDLAPGGSLQIDQDFPWTGAIALQGSGGDATGYWTEVSAP